VFSGSTTSSRCRRISSAASARFRAPGSICAACGRSRLAGAPRQAFFRLGREILELIQEPAEVLERSGGPGHPARFWGLALLVEDLERTAERLGAHAGEIRPAVQPGRRIATLRRSAGLGLPVALMSSSEDPVHVA
jgi:hypothetical protein